MKFKQMNRRIHLYLGLFLLPWVLMYGISSIPFSHNLNKIFDNGKPYWNEASRIERPYSLDIPADADRREIAKQIVKDMGYDMAFGVGMPRQQEFHVYLFSFWHQTRLVYYIEESKVVALDANFRWDHFISGMHARGGYMHDPFLNDLWAFIVDLVCLCMVLWMASGIIIWWQSGKYRNWGLVSLGSGIFSFFILLFSL